MPTIAHALGGADEPDGQATPSLQEQQLKIVNRFSDAIQALAAHAPPALKVELQQATGDLLMILSTASMQQSNAGFHLLAGMVERLQDDLAAVRAAVERLQEEQAGPP